MLKSSLCNYGNAYILFKGTTTITGAGADAAARQGDERNKQVIFKICTPFTDNNIDETKNTQVDNAKDLIALTSMYNLIEFSDYYSKTSSLYQYHRDDPNDEKINSESFKFKPKITGRILNNGNIRNVEIAVKLKTLKTIFQELLSCHEVIAKLTLPQLGLKIMLFLLQLE